jgi:hypothetical protein
MALSGLLCESAMIVMAFQSSPILSRPRARLAVSKALRSATVNAMALVYVHGLIYGGSAAKRLTRAAAQAPCWSDARLR